MGAEGVHFTPEAYSIVTTIETGSTVRSVKIGAEVSREQRRPEAIEGGMIEGTVQLAALAREQQTSGPDIDHFIKLKLADRIEQADRGVSSKTSPTANTLRADNIAVEAVRVELKLHVFVDLPVDVDTSVVDGELIAVGLMVHRSILDGIEAGPDSHADRDPLVIVGLDRSTSIGTRQRGSHPSHQRRHGPSNYKLFPPPHNMSLHTHALPCE